MAALEALVRASRRLGRVAALPGGRGRRGARAAPQRGARGGARADDLLEPERGSSEARARDEIVDLSSCVGQDKDPPIVPK